MTGNMKAANSRTGPWVGLAVRRGFPAVGTVGCSVRRPHSVPDPLWVWALWGEK